jgi:predicted RNase H-like HicB family nuclease
MISESKGLKMSDQLIRTAECLAARPYLIEVKREPGELSADVPGYTAYVKEIPYCVAQGFTEAEARQEIRSALIDYILSLLDRNLRVPEPGAISFSSESKYVIK